MNLIKLQDTPFHYTFFLANLHKLIGIGNVSFPLTNYRFSPQIVPISHWSTYLDPISLYLILRHCYQNATFNNDKILCSCHPNWNLRQTISQTASLGAQHWVNGSLTGVETCSMSKHCIVGGSKGWVVGPTEWCP